MYKRCGEGDLGLVCASLEARRFDFVELRGSTYEGLALARRWTSTRKRKAFFVDFAEMIIPAFSKTKTYITGGFELVGVMLKALNTVDGLGVARPSCRELRLCAAILKGEVEGAIELQLDENNPAVTNLAAGSQIHMMGKDQEAIDLRQKPYEQALQKICRRLEAPHP